MVGMGFLATKSLFSSVTFWGVFTLLVTVLEQALEVLQAIPPELLPKEAQLVLTLLGALLAAVGRLRAKTKLTLF